MRHLIQDIQNKVAGRPVGHVIVGHVSDRQAMIWIQGTKRFSEATLILEAAGSGQLVEEKNLLLREGEDYTDSTVFERLEPGKPYQVTAFFGARSQCHAIEQASREAKAAFTTAPDIDGIGDDTGPGFSFLLGSCNLSVVSINNLGAQALQILGFAAAEAAVDGPISDRREAPRPKASWKVRLGKWWMRRRWRRRAIQWIMRVILGAVFVGTGGKWPRQPILRSPFLKLEALFAGQEIRFVAGSHRPVPGDIIFSHNSGAFGTLAFTPVMRGGRWKENTDKDDEEWKRKDRAEGTMVLVDVHGDFSPDDWLRLAAVRSKPYAVVSSKVVGQLKESCKPDWGYGKPEFTIHAGDQIYYDVPNAKRVPEIEGYWSAYRDAWFEDRYQRSFLARGSHYMTLDDHEIVDQFSLDRQPPEEKKEKDVPLEREQADFSADTYLDRALRAYDDFVQSRHPKAKSPDPKINKLILKASRWFTFSHGKAEFFVMDTRTERRRNRYSQMIGETQMLAFEAWLTHNPTVLKFVVSSVPFVAEIEGEQGGAGGTDRNDDKWCGVPFRRQRDQIIDFIHEKGIDGVVFLVGDMHCAYLASMTIGKGKRWQRGRIHELAGGPISQLDYGRRHQFAATVRKTTRMNGVPYNVRLHQFHGGANAIMHISVGATEDQLNSSMVPEVSWRVIRTLTDPDPKWVRKDQRDGDASPPAELRLEDRPPISGRIVFRPRQKEAAS